MNKHYFDILVCIEENPSLSSQELSEKLFRNEMSVNDEINWLIDNDYFTSNRSLTKKGRQCLSSHKIDNAIILANIVYIINF